MRLSPYDAWVLARLQADVPIEGDLTRASAAVRPLAEAMAGCPWAERDRLFSGFLLHLEDPDAFLRAIADTDPMEPAPAGEGTDGASAPWSLGDLPVRVTRASDIVARPVEWLWQGRVPLGMLTLWAGEPKQGKSFVSLALAAAVSRGAAMPGSSPPAGPASVILMSAEDDSSRTILPRLIAAGADRSRIYTFDSVLTEDGAEALPTLAHDMAHLADVAERLGDCRLIVIDPVSAYLGGVDDHRNAELRGVLSPLKAVAERLNLSVVLLSHLSKGGTGSARNRVIGSVAYVGACRSNALFVRDTQDEAGRRILLLDNGGNLAPPAPTLAYVIRDDGDGARVEWSPDPVEITAEQALAAQQAAYQAATDSSQRREAEEWLKDTLADGPLSAREVKDAARKAGISSRTLERAKANVRVQSRRRGFGREAVYYWNLR